MKIPEHYGADILFFFDGKPLELALYEALFLRLDAEFPEASVRVQKSQISFYGRHLFGAVSLPVRRKKSWPEHCIVVTIGLAAAIVEALTGFAIIPGMAPISEGFETVGTIAIVLAGAFPLVFVVTKLLRKPLMAAGRLLGINDAAAAGLIASLANSIATFGMVKDMNQRGKVVNIAFAVSAAFVFGDHLGYTAGFAPEMLGAMIAGKLVGGVSAIAVALWLTRKEEKA